MTNYARREPRHSLSPGNPSVAPWCSPQADFQAVLSVHVPGSRPLRSPKLLFDWPCLASISRALLSRHADFTRDCDTAEEAATRHPRPPSNPASKRTRRRRGRQRTASLATPHEMTRTWRTGSRSRATRASLAVALPLCGGLGGGCGSHAVAHPSPAAAQQQRRRGDRVSGRER